MPPRPPYPTPDPDVNSLIDRLNSEVQAILADYFVGLYLHGSLAIGDFDPRRSDIDFLVVTADDLPEERIAALESVHARIKNTDGLVWRTNFEGSYIPLRPLRRFDPADSTHPAVQVDGSFGLARHGSEWVIQRYVIRGHGIVVSGPSPETLIDPIGPDELRQATRAVLHDWWAPQLGNSFRLQDSEYQAYAILTMCRALYTLNHGAVVSKPVAARQMQEALGEPWASLIEQAVAWRHGTKMDAMAKTLDFIRFTLATVGENRIPHTQHGAGA